MQYELKKIAKTWLKQGRQACSIEQVQERLHLIRGQ